MEYGLFGFGVPERDQEPVLPDHHEPTDDPFTRSRGLLESIITDLDGT